MTSPASIPAGWYGDPQTRANSLRYWNGSTWTEHVAPRVQATAAPAAGWGAQSAGGTSTMTGVGQSPRDAMHWLVPTGRPWQSIAAPYVGLISLALFFLGPVAIALGVVGVRAANRTGLHGRGRAVFGIVTGCLSTLVLVAFVSAAVFGD
jgi:hypothetical protein